MELQSCMLALMCVLSAVTLKHMFIPASLPFQREWKLTTSIVCALENTVATPLNFILAMHPQNLQSVWPHHNHYIFHSVMYI